MSDNEQQSKVQEQIERYLIDSKIATVGRIRELLLSDEFMETFVKKFFSTPMPTSIQSIDPAAGSSFSVISTLNASGEVVQ